jgi:peptide/nickel transport system permease protein
MTEQLKNLPDANVAGHMRVTKRFVSALRKMPPGDLRQLVVGSVILMVLVVFAAFPILVAPYDPLAFSGGINSPPSWAHLWGTDNLGRDVFSRSIAGARSSLMVSLVSVLISILLGAPAGAVSGYFGGRIDKTSTMVVDAWWAFPTIVFAILISVMLGASAINTALAVGIAVSPSFFRVVRSLTISLKELPFIEAERCIGAHSLRIIFVHIFPNTLPSILVLATLGVGQAILAVSGLGFLGVGIPPPIPEWGTDLGAARGALVSGIWWASAFPGVMILITVVGFNLFGEGLRVLVTAGYRG